MPYWEVILKVKTELLSLVSLFACSFYPFLEMGLNIISLWKLEIMLDVWQIVDVIFLLQNVKHMLRWELVLQVEIKVQIWCPSLWSISTRVIVGWVTFSHFFFQVREIICRMCCYELTGDLKPDRQGKGKVSWPSWTTLDCVTLFRQPIKIKEKDCDYTVFQ